MPEAAVWVIHQFAHKVNSHIVACFVWHSLLAHSLTGSAIGVLQVTKARYGIATAFAFTASPLPSAAVVGAARRGRTGSESARPCPSNWRVRIPLICSSVQVCTSRARNLSQAVIVAFGFRCMLCAFHSLHRYFISIQILNEIYKRQKATRCVVLEI